MLNHNSDLTDVYSIFQKRDLLSPPHNEHPKLLVWENTAGCLTEVHLILQY